MEGRLAEQPLAELIREINRTGLSGSLRLSRERAKVAIYFDQGELIFAASNMRAHRLREVLSREGIDAADLDEQAPARTDDELAKALLASGKLTTSKLENARAHQASDVLRVALLWTDGQWQFDERVRLANGDRVRVDVGRLLLECARHLPFPFIQSRSEQNNGGYLFTNKNSSLNLLPSEAAVLSRAANAGTYVQVPDLKINGTTDEDILRGVYALSLSGLLEPRGWPPALTKEPDDAALDAVPQKTQPTPEDEVDTLFARLKTSRDHYELLDVPRGATEEQIKQAYHALALRFHPDRFHQSQPALKGQIESAFARIARAYEVLGDQQQRSSYDKKLGKPEAGRGQKQERTGATTQSNRAESSFQRGMKALESKQFDDAIRLLAEAAMLEPRQPRYRANYGYALISRPNMRRTAETELQAALSLDPSNSAYRVMLAELYQTVGLRRRAEGEAARALTLDPMNKAARALLSSLKSDTVNK